MESVMRAMLPNFISGSNLTSPISFRPLGGN